MSKFSPGPVQPEEQLTRFLFHPMHFGRKGELKPSVFSHVQKQGCSVQREDIASEKELTDFVRDFLNGASDREWRGVLVAQCRDVRSISVGQTDRRAACVYDTAETKNPAHAELFRTSHLADDGDQNELRSNLFKAFGNGVAITPEAYRAGGILAKVKDQ